MTTTTTSTLTAELKLKEVVENIKSSVDAWGCLFSLDGTFQGDKLQLQVLKREVDDMNNTIRQEFLLYIVTVVVYKDIPLEVIDDIKALAQNASILQLKLESAITNEKFLIEGEDMQLTIEIIKSNFEKNILFYLQTSD